MRFFVALLLFFAAQAHAQIVVDCSSGTWVSAEISVLEGNTEKRSKVIDLAQLGVQKIAFNKGAAFTATAVRMTCSWVLPGLPKPVVHRIDLPLPAAELIADGLVPPFDVVVDEPVPGVKRVTLGKRPAAGTAEGPTNVASQ